MASISPVERKFLKNSGLNEYYARYGRTEMEAYRKIKRYRARYS